MRNRFTVTQHIANPYGYWRFTPFDILTCLSSATYSIWRTDRLTLQTCDGYADILCRYCNGKTL